jgi:hypothetical protein
MKKQTAVEWLIEQIIKEKGLVDLDIQEAKAMEKHQISMAHLEGATSMHLKTYKSGDNYYDEKYGDK